MVILNNGVEVEWDFNRQVSLNVPPTMTSQLSGLCGNYDNDPGNDLQLGPTVNQPHLCSVNMTPEAKQGAIVSVVRTGLCSYVGRLGYDYVVYECKVV